MKKLIKLVMISVFVLIIIPINANAGQDIIEEPINETIIVDSYDTQLPNGDTLNIVIEENVSQGPVARSTSKSKSGNKTVSYKNSSGTVLFSVTVTGSYTYTGSSATCTSASSSVSIKNSNWKKHSSSSSKSGRSATAKASIGYYVLALLQRTQTLDVSLSCSNNGSLS